MLILFYLHFVGFCKIKIDIKICSTTVEGDITLLVILQI